VSVWAWLKELVSTPMRLKREYKSKMCEVLTRVTDRSDPLSDTAVFKITSTLRSHKLCKDKK